ncbi:MAG: DNA repair exonuclease SbcCD nuclease subunit [Mariniblastus sp.]|jgi:DNA repair exonuclease SbcCD nuclease subunit
MVDSKKSRDYFGLLVIGDPHIEGRQPGFRKDDFPEVILAKVQWCINYARSNQLLPTFLGDMFDKPRDNPTWMIGRLIEMLAPYPAIGIFGNHDCAETTLNENDSLSILIKSGCLKIVSKSSPWRGEMNERLVFVGGSSYREEVPHEFSVRTSRRRNLFDEDPFVVWLTHHDIDIAGYENGRFKPHEIENVDLLINGHIHRRLDTVRAGRTHWMTPGNISRRSRSEACKEHVPTVIRIDVEPDNYKLTDVVVPHQNHEDVFHSVAAQALAESSSSEFVTGLAELNALRTQSGAGLHEFLNENLVQFDKQVAKEINVLANEVTGTEEYHDAT